MKAIVFSEYGSPDGLELKEVEKPRPKAHEVLLRTHAVSLNGSDWEFLRGSPFYARLIGLFRPKKQILGSDIAGVVEEVGAAVTQFKPGDEVFGDVLETLGGLAEYTCAPAKKLMMKPASMSFEEIATIPQGSTIALQGLRTRRPVQPGHHVLINGAGGSAGMFAIQLAKHMGAEVTAIDNGKKLEFMRSIGADHVLDYTQEDFASKNTRYDRILDLVAYRSLFDFKRVLKPNGVYSLVGGSMRRIFQTLFVGSLLSLFGSKKFGILAHHQNAKDLSTIIELITEGKVTPVIARSFPLENAADAFRYLGEGNALGKVVVTMPQLKEL